MAAALWYLQWTTLTGALRQRLRRLKQPKYLLGGLLFLAYFGFMFGQPAWQARHGPMRLFGALALDATGAVFAIMLFVWALLSWVMPSGRTALRFTEAEVAFLFPAPLTRVGLINFSLLRAQLAIFLSAFLLSLVFGRGRGLPGNALQHATSIWVAFATMRLHSLAASFTLDRLAEGASRPWLRRMLVPTLIVLGLLALVAWLVTQAPPPPAMRTGADAKLLVAWAIALMHAPPLSWLLAPFRWLSAPLVSANSGWGWSLLPAFALLLANYYWVVRANVAFEEASIEAASKRAQQVQDMRNGKWPWRRKRSANNAPFALAERGPPALAFLWSGLIGAGGGFWRPRNLGLIVGGTVLLVLAMAASPWAVLLKGAGAIALVAFVVAVSGGAMMMQGRLREVLDLLDIYKASPLPGRQIALGQLLTPAAMVALAQWYALFVMMLCVLASGNADLGKFSFTWAGAFGAALLGPLLCALLMCIPFAWILWFPAWAASIGSRGGGFEAAGQRMIFMLVYVIAAALALLPALLLGGLVAWVCSLLGAPMGLLLVIVAVVAAVVLVIELAAIIELLGGRIDRFDVSTELR
jgi:hypothetical protein